MRIFRVEVDMNAPVELTKEQIDDLEKAAQSPIVYDEECPPQTKEELKQFRRVKVKKEKNLKWLDTKNASTFGSVFFI